MRNLAKVVAAIGLAALVISIVGISGVTGFAQGGGRGRGLAPAAPSVPHDPHDLSGIWLGRAVGAIYKAPPSFTPAGKAVFDANTPSFGPRAIPWKVGRGRGRVRLLQAA